MAAQDVASQISALVEKIKLVQAPPDLSERILVRLDRLAKLSESTAVFDEIDKVADYVDWVASLPWNKKSDDILDINHARSVLDKNHYGLTDIKERILEFIAILKLNKEKQEVARAPIFCFVGLVGTGKTTVAFSIAEALGRKIARIPFGGMGSPLDLRGQSRLHAEAEPGLVMKALRKVETKNPVVLLDEIDRVADEGRSSIMGVLVELLDPEQNMTFLDHYIDYPFDLSEVMFIATANNTTNIATAVLDRLEIISMPSYTDQEKITVAKSYMLPKIIKESGLPDGFVSFDENVWPTIVRPLGYDAGMRTLERSIEGIVRKIAKDYVEGKTQPVYLNEQNIKQYLI